MIELRASIVIGSGSASFELIRALVERLPVMVTPRWVNTAAQPIGIEDVVEYLVEAIGVHGRRRHESKSIAAATRSKPSKASCSRAIPTSKGCSWRCQTGRPSCASSRTSNAAERRPGGAKETGWQKLQGLME